MIKRFWVRLAPILHGRPLRYINHFAETHLRCVSILARLISKTTL